MKTAEQWAGIITARLPYVFSTTILPSIQQALEYQRGFIEGQKAMRERATKEADYHWQRGHNPTRAIRNLPIKDGE